MKPRTTAQPRRPASGRLDSCPRAMDPCKASLPTLHSKP